MTVANGETQSWFHHVIDHVSVQSVCCVTLVTEHYVFGFQVSVDDPI